MAKYGSRPKTQLERPTAENPAESRSAGPSHAVGQPEEAAGHTCMESARSTLEVQGADDHKIISYVEILDHVELSKYFPHFSMMNFEKVKPRSPRVFGTRELHGFTFLKFIEKWRI